MAKNIYPRINYEEFHIAFKRIVHSLGAQTIEGQKTFFLKVTKENILTVLALLCFNKYTLHKFYKNNDTILFVEDDYENIYWELNDIFLNEDYVYFSICPDEKKFLIFDNTSRNHLNIKIPRLYSLNDVWNEIRKFHAHHWKTIPSDVFYIEFYSDYEGKRVVNFFEREGFWVSHNLKDLSLDKSKCKKRYISILKNSKEISLIEGNYVKDVYVPSEIYGIYSDFNFIIFKNSLWAEYDILTQYFHMPPVVFAKLKYITAPEVIRVLLCLSNFNINPILLKSQTDSNYLKIPLYPSLYKERPYYKLFYTKEDVSATKIVVSPFNSIESRVYDFNKTSLDIPKWFLNLYNIKSPKDLIETEKYYMVNNLKEAQKAQAEKFGDNLKDKKMDNTNCDSYYINWDKMDPDIDSHEYKPGEILVNANPGEMKINIPDIDVEGILNSPKDTDSSIGHTTAYAPCSTETNQTIIKTIENICTDLKGDIIMSATSNATANTINTGNVTKATTDNLLAPMFNFEFGPLDQSKFCGTLMGTGVCVDGTWRVYDPSQRSIIDMPAELNANSFPAFAIPSSEVKTGDLIKANGKLYYVTDITFTGINAVDISAGESTSLTKTTNILNMNFYTKVVSMADFLEGSGDSDDKLMLMFLMQNPQMQNNPMMPFMLMEIMSKDADSEDGTPKKGLLSGSMGKMLMLSSMMGNYNNNGTPQGSMNNMMTMAFMMKAMGKKLF